MQVLKTTSPVTPSGTGAPNRTPSKQRPVSSASRPRSGTRDRRQSRQLERRGEVGDGPLVRGEEHPSAEPDAGKGGVAAPRAERLGANLPLLLGVEEHEAARLPQAQARLAQSGGGAENPPWAGGEPLDE